jgi:hypothetical protein
MALDRRHLSCARNVLSEAISAITKLFLRQAEVLAPLSLSKSEGPLS